MNNQRIFSRLLLPTFVLCLFFGCSQKTTPAGLQEQLSLQKTTMTSMLEELLQLRNGINVQGRALTDAEHDFVRDVNDLETDYIGWQALEEPSGKKDLQRRLQALEALTERAERLLERDLPGKEN